MVRSGNVALSLSNTPIVVGGADGSKDGAYSFVAASSQSLAATDAGGALAVWAVAP